MSAPETSQYFSNNMAVLKSIFPDLADELSKSKSSTNLHGEDSGIDGEDELKIETAASGAPTLICRGIYIHSKRDPLREAERLAEGTGDDEVPALVLGFGLGYAASALAARFPGKPIIIVEKRPEVFKKALEVRDLTPLLSRERVVFVLGGDGDGVTGALSLFKSSPGTPPPVIQNRALTGLDESWYSAVEERIKIWNTRTSVNRATQKRFGTRWVRNLSKNLEAVRDRPGISRLEGLLSQTDIPVFLAAAGPTLNETSAILDEVYKRCIIVAVDTSLRFLLEEGIDPDFVVSVDPQYWNFRHLDRAVAGKTRLVTESAVYPPLLRHPFAGTFLCGSFFPLGRFIEDRLDEKGDLGTGGSVATSAWDFARRLGAVNVWIAGLDLSFPELKTHFRGGRFEEKSLSESGHFSPVETWNFRALRDGHPFLAKRKGGGMVLTDKRLSLYAAWFENRFYQFPEIKNYCFSDEGLEIKGLETARFETLLDLPERRKEIENLLSGLYRDIEGSFNSTEDRKTRAERYERAINTLLEGLREIKNLAGEAAEVAGTASLRRKLGHLGEAEQEKTMRKLDAANTAIKKSAVKDIAGFLFPETEGWEQEIASANKDPLMRHLEFSARFYTALKETAEYNLKILTKKDIYD